MRIQLPRVAFDAPDTISPAETIVDALRGHFSEVTLCKVHSGTRIYRLLDLDCEYDNVFLVNLYNASPSSAARVLSQILAQLNGDPDIGFKMRIAPRGYAINGVDITSIAYMIGLLVYTSDQLDQPDGVVFVQTYSTDRAHAATLKAEDDEDDEYE